MEHNHYVGETHHFTHYVVATTRSGLVIFDNVVEVLWLSRSCCVVLQGVLCLRLVLLASLPLVLLSFVGLFPLKGALLRMAQAHVTQGRSPWRCWGTTQAQRFSITLKIHTNDMDNTRFDSRNELQAKRVVLYKGKD